MTVDEDQVLYATGFEGALLGTGQRFGYFVAIYSMSKCIKILMDRDGMDLDEATEYMDFNVTGSYMGENTPIFLLDHEESK